jgi:hypothetical protein
VKLESIAEQPFWGAVPTLLWILFLWSVLFAFRAPIRALLATLETRLRLGAPIKLGSVELGAAIAMPGRLGALKEEKQRGIRPDEDGRRIQERQRYYTDTRRVMLVHRLFRSTEEGQLYDILIYLVPSYKGYLTGVVKVEYFFGGYGWENQIFPSADRSRGFPVLTAAYGPFLCTAEVFFSDGYSVMLHRYIDFEMGDYAIALQP